LRNAGHTRGAHMTVRAELRGQSGTAHGALRQVDGDGTAPPDPRAGRTSRRPSPCRTGPRGRSADRAPRWPRPRRPGRAPHAWPPREPLRRSRTANRAPARIMRRDQRADGHHVGGARERDEEPVPSRQPRPQMLSEARRGLLQVRPRSGPRPLHVRDARSAAKAGSNPASRPHDAVWRARTTTAAGARAGDTATRRRPRGPRPARHASEPLPRAAARRAGRRA